MAVAAQAQVRPYIGFAYPAGGQQGASFHIRLGGQGLDGVHAVLVTGSASPPRSDEMTGGLTTRRCNCSTSNCGF